MPNCQQKNVIISTKNINQCNIMVHRKVTHMMETLGSRLKQLRKNNHWKQEQVANWVEVTRSCICTYENDSREPSVDILIRLAELYHVTVDFLVGVQQEPVGAFGLTPSDLAVLSPSDVAVITLMLENMVEKNKRLLECQKISNGKKR